MTDILLNLVAMEIDARNADLVKEKENAIISLGEHFSQNNLSADLLQLIKSIRPFLQQTSKAKSGKIVRTLVDLYMEVDVEAEEKIELCRECIEWTKVERRNYLRQNLEAKLLEVLSKNGRFEEALVIIGTLSKELKTLDDKALLIEVQLIESRVYYSLSNLVRSKAALTSARTSANVIYCTPKLQASLDLQSGILHAADQRDFKTAYSYFYEAFEAFDSVDKNMSVTALKYMLLSKIMLNCSEEIPTILAGKLASKYKGDDIDAMREISQAASRRSFSSYLSVQEKYKANLTMDPVISKHLSHLYDTLLGHNLIKLTESYSTVQMEYLAGLLELPLEIVEKKLSQMILDKELNGILDQESGTLMLIEKQEDDHACHAVLDIIHSLKGVLDELYVKAENLI